MRLAVLGPVTLTGGGAPVPITPRKARELLTILALEHPRPLSLAALSTRLWDDPPPAAAKTVQGLLSRLRRDLATAGASAPGITGGPSGYRLTEPGELDVLEFHRLVRAGRQSMQAGTWTLATDALGQARAVLRGQPELPATAAGDALRTWLDELRDGIAEDHVAATIQAGRLDDALAELELMIPARPLHERLRELRMVAQARSGRVADALGTYRDARRVLLDQLGVEPGAELRRLEREILAGDTPSTTPRAVAHRAAPGAPTAGPPATGGDPLRAEVRYVAVDDVHIAYCTVGDADADLVIMNAGVLPADCILTERRLAGAVRRLTSFARVTWFNHRGVGLSDRCTADQLPTVADWARDLAAVLDAVGATAPVVYASEETTAVTFRLAADRPDRLAGIVLSNACARFTRGQGYPYGVDPLLAEQNATETTAAQPCGGRFDLLTVIAPTAATDPVFRAWWDAAGRRGASPRVARALRSRFQNSDIRALVGDVTVPVLHFVNPAAPAHQPGHDRYLQEHLAQVETHRLPGPDELWWLDTSGIFLAEVERFVRERATGRRRV